MPERRGLAGQGSDVQIRINIFTVTHVARRFFKFANDKDRGLGPRYLWRFTDDRDGYDVHGIGMHY